MAKKFTKLNKSNIRKLLVGQKLTEHGITFERMADGDGRYTINIMVNGQRVHRVVGLESERTNRSQAESYIEKIRQEAKADRLNLPEGRKLALTFKEAAEIYVKRLNQEGGKDIVR